MKVDSIQKIIPINRKVRKIILPNNEEIIIQSAQKEDAATLKAEMDTYLEKELGVDVGKLNQQIVEAQDKMSNMASKNKDISPDEPGQD